MLKCAKLRLHTTWIQMFYSTDEKKKLQTQLVYGSPFVPGKKNRWNVGNYKNKNTHGEINIEIIKNKKMAK